MKNLVRRYVTQEQQKAENEGVTEDDVNEIKNDISAFRFELIEIMRQSGMKVSSSSGLLGKKAWLGCVPCPKLCGATHSSASDPYVVVFVLLLRNRIKFR